MAVQGTLVVTTIFDPKLLEDYFRNFVDFDRLDQVDVIVIPDRKTPAAAYERCSSLRNRGLRISCPSLEEQELFLRRVGFPVSLIPYDSDNRRNIGYLMALDGGSDFVISIDDDNYCRAEEDLFGEHAIVCDGHQRMETTEVANGWFNACSALKFDRSEVAYPRGFPYYARHKEQTPTVSTHMSDIHINAGLWLIDPDMDGISWLVNPVSSTEFPGKSFVLGDNTWCPVNTQNTSLRRDVLPSYYFVRMGYSVGGIPIDRYGDIFSGYFAQACMRHLGGKLRFGTPVAEHKRNSHNYLKDSASEWACILMLEDLLPWLTTDVKLSGLTYAEAYLSLAEELDQVVERLKGMVWKPEARAYFHEMTMCMRQWVETCQRICGSGSGRVEIREREAVVSDGAR